MTLDEVDALSAAEVNLWREYQRRNGFPIDRIVWTIANIGAALWNQQRSKNQSALEPRRFVPRFTPKSEEMKVIAAQLANLPGAVVRKMPRKVNDGR